MDGLVQAVASLGIPYTTCAGLQEALTSAIEQAGENGAVLMTGSIYGMGEIYKEWKSKFSPFEAVPGG